MRRNLPRQKNSPNSTDIDAAAAATTRSSRSNPLVSRMQPTIPRPHATAARPLASPSACLTTAALADLLRVSVRKLERDRQNGTGVRYVRFGRRVIYRRVDVEAFLDRNSFGSTAEAKRTEEDR